jgi:RNA polymerase sigma-70 factor (ECF subfamily)
MSAIGPADDELWEAALRGDAESFGQLFDRHARAVYNHCFRLTASWSRAEDAASTAFLTAWRKRDRLRLVNGSALPWLLVVATNVTRDQWRAGRRRRLLADRLRADPNIADHADDVAGRIDDQRRMAEVLAAIKRLPRGEREAVVMCLWAGVSYPDAAEALGIAESAVRARVSRARSRLRAEFAPPPNAAPSGPPPASPTTSPITPTMPPPTRLGHPTRQEMS